MDGYDADKYIDMVGTGYDSIADAYFANYRVNIPGVVKDKVAKFDATFDDGHTTSRRGYWLRNRAAEIEELINPGDGDTERHLWLVARKT
jgi:hypothetical protein